MPMEMAFLSGYLQFLSMPGCLTSKMGAPRMSLKHRQKTDFGPKLQLASKNTCGQNTPP